MHVPVVTHAGHAGTRPGGIGIGTRWQHVKVVNLGSSPGTRIEVDGDAGSAEFINQIAVTDAGAVVDDIAVGGADLVASCINSIGVDIGALADGDGASVEGRRGTGGGTIKGVVELGSRVDIVLHGEGDGLGAGVGACGRRDGHGRCGSISDGARFLDLVIEDLTLPVALGVHGQRTDAGGLVRSGRGTDGADLGASHILGAALGRQGAVCGVVDDRSGVHIILGGQGNSLVAHIAAGGHGRLNDRSGGDVVDERLQTGVVVLVYGQGAQPEIANLALIHDGEGLAGLVIGGAGGRDGAITGVVNPCSRVGIILDTQREFLRAGVGAGRGRSRYHRSCGVSGKRLTGHAEHAGSQ